ncbi:MAG: hypothetical protein Q8L85_06995 [Alphaproteobacteria bacterium]|nr:hypothetical protein [Alphaproteobacteria bacterium]
MKKLFLLHILIAINTLSISFANSPQDASAVQIIDTIQQEDTAKKNWTRVTTRFKREQFLVDCDLEHHTEYSKLISIHPNNEEILNETCWKALFKLKDSYKPNEDRSNYTFAYQSMAKFLLTYNVFPQKCNTKIKQNDFLNQLINKIGQGITPRLAPHKHQKIKRWFHIYEGMLFLKYANMFAKEDRRERHIVNAYHEFTKAIELKTTKTTYLLAAEAILDYGHIPAGMTQEEAEKLAYDYIEIAETRQERPSSNRAENAQEREKQTTVEIHARPTYMIEINLLNGPKNNQEQSPENQREQLLPDVFFVTEDALLNYDYTQLIIPRRLNAAHLPVRNNPINRIGDLQEIYDIDGRRVRRQNVAGTNMRCFFNAIGLNPNGQVAQLAFFSNDPIVRYMLANEIVSAARDPDQIPIQVKTAINYDLYRMERAALDALEETRNALLLEQNPNEHFQNIALLPLQYQNLGQRGEEILEQLRRRALSLNAYNAFIDHHIGNEEMMVTLLDLQNNGNANFTSIDAIAYLNDIGIKIFTPHQEEGLTLIHEYIPENATEVAYIYHQGVHFQALVPVEDVIAENDNENELNIETENSSDLQLPDIKKLRNIYPKVVTFIYHREYEDDLVRKILYSKEHLHKKAKEIGLNFNLDGRRISEILTSNNIRNLHYVSENIKEKLLQSYLECYKNIKSKKISQKEHANAFLKRFKNDLENSIDEKKIAHILITLFREQKFDESLDQKQKNRIIRLYSKGKGFFIIRDKTGINLLTIMSILSENLNPKDYKNPINLELKKEALSEDEKNRLIIDIFQKIKKDTGKDPSISGVKNALKDYKIGYKTCERILKTNNLVQQNIKSQHISEKEQKEIKKEFNKLNPPQGKIEETYKSLAKKHNVTKGQVLDLIKNRTFESKRKKEIQDNFDKIVKAYHNLSDEQKEKPFTHIEKIVPLTKPAIRNHLEKAGLYQSNGMRGKSTINILAKNDIQPKKNKILAKRKIEDDSDKNKPSKKKKTKKE